MNTSPSPYDTQRESISLSKLATIFAVSFAIAFGLCTVSATSVVEGSPRIGGGLIWLSVAVEGVCFIGLLAVGSVAIFRSIRGK